MNSIKQFTPNETKLYFYLLHHCFLSGGRSKFELPTRNIECNLLITRKTLCQLRNNLRDRGLIDFTENVGSKTPVYALKQD